MRGRDLTLIGRLPEYQIPVYWDAASERFIKVSPYPPGSVDKNRKPISGKLVRDEHGRQVPSEVFVRKMKGRAMCKAALILVMTLVCFFGLKLSRRGLTAEAPSASVTVAALVVGILLGCWVSWRVSKKTYAGFVMPASPREVAAAAREGGVDSVRGFQYHLGSLPMTIGFEILLWGVPMVFFVGICLPSSVIRVLAFPFLGVLAFVGVGIMWFLFFADHFDSWRHRHRDASEVWGM